MTEELQQITKKASPWNTGMKWGIIFFVVTAAMYYLTHMGVDYTSTESLEQAQKNPINQYGVFVVMIAVLVLAQMEHRKKDLGGFLSYGRAVGIGTIVFLISSGLDSMLTYIEMSIIHPESIHTLIQIQMQNAQEMGFTENLDESYERAKKLTTPFNVSLFKFFGGILFGVIVTLIVSIFTRKANPDEI